MSKAEERAKGRYWLEPSNIETQEKYAAYVEGYHQAEKDLELTWKDIKMIYRLVCVVADDLGIKAMNTNIYEEVLKRFKEEKEKIDN